MQSMELTILIQETLEDLLQKIGVDFSKVSVGNEDSSIYRVNVETKDPSLLIGYHGENIYAIQQILKILCWKKSNQSSFAVIVDVDNYRKRQEENVIKLAERKVEIVRKTGKSISLPPMTPYFRRIVHMHLMDNQFSDIESVSVGEDDMRHITLHPKS